MSAASFPANGEPSLVSIPSPRPAWLRPERPMEPTVVMVRILPQDTGFACFYGITELQQMGAAEVLGGIQRADMDERRLTS